MHAEVVVDDVHAVDVEIEHAFRHRFAPGRELRAHLGLERGARQERGQRVVVVLERGRRLARQELDETLGARLEVRGILFPEHHEESDDAAGGVAHRRAEDLVGRQLDRAHLDLVDHEIAPLQLRPVEQVPVDLGQDLDLRALAARRLADRDVALGHDERAEQAVEVIDAGLHQHAELVALERAVRIVRRHLEEQLEVVVARAQVARQEIDARPGLELALQALERRLHHRLHERIGTVFAVAREERRDRDDIAFVVAEPEYVGGRALVVLDEAVDAAGRGGRNARERRQHERRRIGPFVTLRHPERTALGVVEADAERARHQHPQELPVRIEVGLCAREMRRQIDGCDRGHRRQRRSGRPGRL